MTGPAHGWPAGLTRSDRGCRPRNRASAGQPRSERDAAILKRFDTMMQLPIIVSAILPLLVVPEMTALRRQVEALTERLAQASPNPPHEEPLPRGDAPG